MSKMKSTAEQKKLKVFSQFCQNFWTLENTLWTGKTKVELFRKCVSHYAWCKSNTIFQKRHIITAVKYGGGCVMAWGCFAVLGPGRLAVIN